MASKSTFDVGVVVLETLDNEFEAVLSFARMNQTCKRKAVGCSVWDIARGSFGRVIMVHNGPSVPGNECTNVVGNCGCSHAEPRAVLKARGMRLRRAVMVCTYSPCTNCANIIIDSGAIPVVCYDILTEHDKRGAEFLRAAGLQVITREQIRKAINQEDPRIVADWL